MLHWGLHTAGAALVGTLALQAAHPVSAKVVAPSAALHMQEDTPHPASLCTWVGALPHSVGLCLTFSSLWDPLWRCAVWAIWDAGSLNTTGCAVLHPTALAPRAGSCTRCWGREGTPQDWLLLQLKQQGQRSEAAGWEPGSGMLTPHGPQAACKWPCGQLWCKRMSLLQRVCNLNRQDKHRVRGETETQRSKVTCPK